VTEDVAVSPRAVGLLGGGVIGSGWAARFLLHGVDVRLFDPDPEAERRVAEALENARRAWGKLTLMPLPSEGALTLVSSAEDAAADVDFVQESAPEREGLKRELIATASRAAPADVIFASSTSGILPSLLQQDMRHPQRLVVGHPFNPVYLVPLVEVCGGERTAPETIERVETTYRSVGMAPLRVRREIEGFIADRLMEALWREALWLVNDDVATVEDLDDAIRLGAGLRWAFMGTFLTYRIAGGEDGMRHFMQQFGPALHWPWSKLTDVPPLTGGLLDKVAEQSDAQARGRSVRELERLRDDCLVAVVQALRACGEGAGAVLAAHERRLFDAGGPLVMQDADDLSRPLRLLAMRVRPDWLDYNGHVHESRYLQVFGDASDALFRYVGIDREYLARNGTYYTVETHLSFQRELRAGDELHVDTQVLGFDDRRLHAFHSLHRPGDQAPLAAAEQMFVHVDAKKRRAAPATPEVLARIGRIAMAHASLPRPERAGRGIALPARRRVVAPETA
jgi:carnitine 3-dehydrogenase